MTKPAYSYDELDEILRGKGDNDAVGMSLIDGLIAALVAGPVFVDPREWLPLIFAGPGRLSVDNWLRRRLKLQ